MTNKIKKKMNTGTKQKEQDLINFDILEYDKEKIKPIILESSLQAKPQFLQRNTNSKSINRNKKAKKKLNLKTSNTKSPHIKYTQTVNKSKTATNSLRMKKQDLTTNQSTHANFFKNEILHSKIQKHNTADRNLLKETESKTNISKADALSPKSSTKIENFIPLQLNKMLSKTRRSQSRERTKKRNILRKYENKTTSLNKKGFIKSYKQINKEKNEKNILEKGNDNINKFRGNFILENKPTSLKIPLSKNTQSKNDGLCKFKSKTRNIKRSDFQKPTDIDKLANSNTKKYYFKSRNKKSHLLNKSKEKFKDLHRINNQQDQNTEFKSQKAMSPTEKKLKTYLSRPKKNLKQAPKNKFREQKNGCFSNLDMVNKNPSQNQGNNNKFYKSIYIIT